MRLQYHIIDAFTGKIFGGNPAGVCVLDEWLPDGVMQSIAAENNLPETAFLVKQDGYYGLRWFTPEVEVELCGHGTLASAYVLFDGAERAANELRFKTMSGMLAVTREPDGLLYLDFPARPVEPCPIYPAFERAFGVKPAAAFKAVDFMVLLDSEQTLRELKPDLAALRELRAESGTCGCKATTGGFGVIVTARSREVDFVSRFFAPELGIAEDPVTGRAHCSLIPYWNARLGKQKLTARQFSKRGGELFCEDCGARVKIGGRAVRYLRGEIEVG